MKRILFILSFFAVIAVHGQDTIFRWDHTRIVCKVLTIDDKEISYHRKEDRGDYTRSIRLRLVESVHYRSGEIKSFPKPNPESPRYPARDDGYEPDVMLSDYDTMAHNTIYLNGFDMLFGVLTASYERSFKGGVVSMRIPISTGAGYLGGTWDNNTGWNNNRYYYNQNKIFSSGVEILFSPGTARENGRILMGAAIEFGAGYSRSYYGQSTNTRVTYSGVGMKFGGVYHLSEHITIGTDFTVGMITLTSDNDIAPLGRGSLLMGYRF